VLVYHEQQREQEQGRILPGPNRLVAASDLYRVPLQALLRILESVREPHGDVLACVLHHLDDVGDLS
jgi:hypothetical protein